MGVGDEETKKVEEFGARRWLSEQAGREEDEKGKIGKQKWETGNPGKFPIDFL